jgi:hypothetical protein
MMVRILTGTIIQVERAIFSGENTTHTGSKRQKAGRADTAASRIVSCGSEI